MAKNKKENSSLDARLGEAVCKRGNDAPKYKDYIIPINAGGLTGKIMKTQDSMLLGMAK